MLTRDDDLTQSISSEISIVKARYLPLVGHVNWVWTHERQPLPETLQTPSLQRLC